MPRQQDGRFFFARRARDGSQGLQALIVGPQHFSPPGRADEGASALPGGKTRSSRQPGIEIPGNHRAPCRAKGIDARQAEGWTAKADDEMNREPAIFCWKKFDRLDASPTGYMSIFL